MKRINLIMMSIFLGGCLLIGIGAGVAFGEYSTLKYGGKKEIGAEKTEEIVLDYEIPTGKAAKKTILTNHSYVPYTLEEDKKVPEGTVRYEIEYNSNLITPYLDYSPAYMTDTEEYEGHLYLSGHSKMSDVEFFMEYKDEMLEELKNHKISSYNYNPWKSVTIKVNPKTMKYIEEF